MESQFLSASQDYVYRHIQRYSQPLRDRITRSQASYQEHLEAAMRDAQASTSDSLASLYHIPRHAHSKPLDVLFTQLSLYLRGAEGSVILEDVLGNFFTHMFPQVFRYVFVDASKVSEVGVMGKEFDSCIMDYSDEIQPFGKIPAQLGRRIKQAFQRARIFGETLRVMQEVLNQTEQVQLDGDCKKAVTRFRFCPMCAGEVGSSSSASQPEVEEVQQCRGLCLNVMRGCLAKITEISSSWDDLVIAFENLQLGVPHRTDVQAVLGHFSGNISEALLTAMGDMPRIHKAVIELCKDDFNPQTDSSAPMKRFSTAQGLQPAARASSGARDTRRDVRLLIQHLEESKGFFQRAADSMCRDKVTVDQEMTSSSCWNGSAIGSYTREVTEANIVSQAKHNPEVKVTLMPDMKALSIKDTLVHMRRNLSKLLNDEKMQSDSTYSDVSGVPLEGPGVGSGGYSSARDEIDDEDLATQYGVGGQGSGSGSGAGGIGDDEDDDDDADRENIEPPGRGETETPTKPKSTKKPTVNRKPPARKPGSDGGSGAVPAVSCSVTLILASMLLAAWWH